MRLLPAVLLAVVLHTAPVAAQERDPQAAEVARAMHEAMGGLDDWNNTRYVRFRFRVGFAGEWTADRAHLWDKWEGHYRYESADREGRWIVALFNVNTKQGRVFADGEQLPPDEAEQQLERAYSAFINDSYWLAMPWKWLDPGVTLVYAGEQEWGGERCDVVELSFESVGLTPGDVYRAFVSKRSRLMIHWEYRLQSDREDAWDWKYIETNGLKLPFTHVQPGGERQINMGSPVASDQVDETIFTDPEKNL